MATGFDSATIFEPEPALNEQLLDDSWQNLDIVPPRSDFIISEIRSDSFQESPNNFQDSSSGFIIPESPPGPSVSSDQTSIKNINQIIAEKGISIEDIIYAGLESITQKFRTNSTGPAITDQISTIPTSYAPSPSTTHLPLRQMALMAACLANAAHIGIDIFEHIRRPTGHCGDEHAPSPFFQPALANMPLTPATIASLYQNTVPDLRPCAAQIKQRHWLYIDTFPIPEFRKRILALRSCVTDGEDGDDGRNKVFDEEEFCRDIDAEGVVC